jgi:general secretion pathway protein G
MSDVKKAGKYLWLLVIAQGFALVVVLGWRVFQPRYSNVPIPRTRADIRGGLTTIFEMFKADCGRYPTTEEGWKVLINAPTDGSLKGWRGPYFDPPEIPKDFWGREYVYRFPGIYNTNGYDLYSRGPDGVSQTSGNDLDDINNWDASSPRGGTFLSSGYSDDQFAAAVEMLLVIPFFYGVRMMAGLFDRRVRGFFAENSWADTVWLLISIAVVVTFLVGVPRLAER